MRKKIKAIISQKTLGIIVVLLIVSIQHCASMELILNKEVSNNSFKNEFSLKDNDVDYTREDGELLLLTKRRHEGIKCQDYLEPLGESLVVIVNGKEEERIKKLNLENGTLIFEVPNYVNSQSLEWVAYNLNKTKKLNGICGLSEDDIIRAGLLRSKLSIKGQSYESALAYRDKIIMKDYLSKEGIKVPKYARAKNIFDVLSFAEKNGYPIVLKPAQGAGSTDAFIIKEESDLEVIANRSNYFESSPGGIDVEEFIEGEMYHIDGLIHDHKILFSWPSKYINQCINFKKGKWLGSMLLSQDNSLVSKLQEVTAQCIKALPNPVGCVFHMEVFHNPKTDDITFCEIASRVGGGLIRQVYKLAFGYDLFIEHTKLQFGVKPNESYQQKPSILGGWVLMSAKGGTVKTVAEPKNMENLTHIDICVKSGEKVEETKDINGSIAEIGFKSSSDEESMNKILEISKMLNLGITWE